jgi:hypothetical protein
MPQKPLVTAAASLEITMGAILISVPDFPCLLLFAAKAEGVSIPIARFAGIGLIALGIACWPPPAGSRPGAMVGLLAFNAGVAILLTWVGVGTAFRGSLLWPAAILHAAIAVALLPQLVSGAKTPSISE